MEKSNAANCSSDGNIIGSEGSVIGFANGGIIGSDGVVIGSVKSTVTKQGISLVGIDSYLCLLSTSN
jgi:hemolysin activation/secretion protein